MPFLPILALKLALASTYAAPAAGPSPAVLETQVSSAIERVEPFREIRELARKMGVRVWLFGGTASSFAHYVKRDELRKAGDKRFQPDRFDYHYTNIYHSSQDLDIVVDGNEAQLRELEEMLKTRFPYFEGSKQLWEVRSLKQRRGDKDALLGDFNFLNQHTDSHSTGMIELTEPSPGNSRIRDLRDWSPPKGRPSNFLRDVAEGTLHFYYAPKHAKTRLAREGFNPPILSVIRYFTKAFKEELKIPEKDAAVLRKLIADFDPKAQRNRRVDKWIEKNGKKLFQHAVSIEYAAEVLDRFGLRKKLASLGDPGKADSLAWWLTRKPLPSLPVGQGSGKTAAQLGITQVSHETRDFLAYESITRAHSGKPNVLTSRQDTAGEAAAHGEGFYTLLGDRGARGTGITIHFDVDPAAREGTDFSIHREIVLFHNRNAFRVTPEKLDISGLGAMNLLLSDDFDLKRDKALLALMQRKLGASERSFTEAELPDAVGIVRKQLRAPSFNLDALKVWFRSPVSVTRRDLVKPFLSLPDEKAVRVMAHLILSSEPWLRLAETDTWIRRLFETPAGLRALLSDANDGVFEKHMERYPEYERLLLEKLAREPRFLEADPDGEFSLRVLRLYKERSWGASPLGPKVLKNLLPEAPRWFGNWKTEARAGISKLAFELDSERLFLKVTQWTKSKDGLDERNVAAKWLVGMGNDLSISQFRKLAAWEKKDGGTLGGALVEVALTNKEWSTNAEVGSLLKQMLRRPKGHEAWKSYAVKLAFVDPSWHHQEAVENLTWIFSQDGGPPVQEGLGASKGLFNAPGSHKMVEAYFSGTRADDWEKGKTPKHDWVDPKVGWDEFFVPAHWYENPKSRKVLHDFALRMVHQNTAPFKRILEHYESQARKPGTLSHLAPLLEGCAKNTNCHEALLDSFFKSERWVRSPDFRKVSERLLARAKPQFRQKAIEKLREHGCLKRFIQSLEGL